MLKPYYSPQETTDPGKEINELQRYLNELQEKRIMDIEQEFGIEGISFGNMRKDKIKSVKSLVIEGEKQKEWHTEVLWKTRKNKDHMGSTILPFETILKKQPREMAMFFIELFKEDIKKNLF